ncbi:MAG: dehydrogenase (ubiquinone) 24 kDa subunit [Caulobacteraceae bacterium]|jgi:formate dehydrogenase subunit gamma|nr:dehydrogenase (ubiquinone) 24 kDa subunit [Caulobacteraceae bacterium]
MPDYIAWSPEQAVAVIAAEADKEGALMPILHALARTFGWIPDEAVPLIAGILNLSRADVHGVLTFYHDFRRSPPPRHVVKLCRAEACQARGGDALAAHAERTLGQKIDAHAHSAGGHENVSLEPVYCLGLCASGPNALVDGRPHARLTADRFDALMAETVR